MNMKRAAIIHVTRSKIKWIWHPITKELPSMLPNLVTYLFVYYFHYGTMWTRNHKMHSICTLKCQMYLLLITQNVFQSASMFKNLVTCIVIIKKKSKRTCNYVSNGGPKNIHKLVGWTCISIAGSCMLSIFWRQQNYLKKCIIMHRYNNKIAYWESILLVW